MNLRFYAAAHYDSDLRLGSWAVSAHEGISVRSIASWCGLEPLRRLRHLELAAIKEAIKEAGPTDIIFTDSFLGVRWLRGNIVPKFEPEIWSAAAADLRARHVTLFHSPLAKTSPAYRLCRDAIEEVVTCNGGDVRD